MNDPNSFFVTNVLRDELDQIEERRGNLPLKRDQDEGAGLAGYARAHRMRPFGVGLSGGGIRSATFNLGLLQGLAERGLLPYIDYLSTVSGGGYIGTWLHGVILRKHGGCPVEAAKKLDPTKNPAPGEADEDPITFLRKYSNYLAPALGLFSGDLWVIGGIWVRNMFLNQLILVPFLAAALLLAILAGMLEQHASGRTSVRIFDLIVATLLLVVTVYTAARDVRFAALRELESSADTDPKKLNPPPPWNTPLCTASMMIASFLLAASHALPTLSDPQETGWCPSDSGLLGVRGGLFCSSAFATLAILALLFCWFQWRNGFKKCYWNRRPKHSPGWRLLLALHFVWIPLVCASVCTGLLLALSWLFGQWDGGHWGAGMGGWHLIAWGPPLVVTVWIIGVSLHIGLMGSDMPDGAREWFARIGAQLGIVSVAWAAWFTLAVFGPYWIALAAMAYFKTTVTAVGGWIATTAGGVLAGKSSKTEGRPKEGEPARKTALEYVGMVAPTVFLVGFLLLISFGVHQAVAALAERSGVPDYAEKLPVKTPRKADQWALTEPAKHFAEYYWPVLDHANWACRFDCRWLDDEKWWCKIECPNPWWLGCTWLLMGLFAGLAAISALVSSRVNINEFSLHHFYKNRLVRCYLGASMGDQRQPNPVTGFDPKDDLPLSKLIAKLPEEKAPEKPKEASSMMARLLPKSPPTGQDPEKFKPYFGPYAILNAVLNLNRGSELAKQERKGSSFMFTPLYSGFDPPRSRRDAEEHEKKKAQMADEGYRKTRGYAYPPAGLSIGTATAISGAAANPNSGFSTSESMAFLLTIFDVRLGWWLGNPRMDGPSSRPGPIFALWYLLKELFAQTDARTKYLNLSDGGFFDNLGLYELVKRRCRYIIIGDAEQDGNYTFESLGGAIRKCRADLGVDIDIDPGRIQPAAGYSRTHCVVGKIKYPGEEDGVAGSAPTGWLVYFKASLTGNEPEDVLQYRASHPAFPHESTGDQFFGESQFESYRRLGLHVADSVFENVVAWRHMHDLFEDLERKWYPPSTVAEGVASRHADAYSGLLKRISETKGLEFMDQRLFKHADPLMDVLPLPAIGTEERRKAFYACLDLIQLMENVYTDLHLGNLADRNNPNNAGWKHTFEYWTSQDIFQDTWKVAGPTYNLLFQEYFQALYEPPGLHAAIHKDEHQHDDEQQTDAAARIIPPTAAIRPSGQQAEQEDDQNNQQ